MAHKRARYHQRHQNITDFYDLCSLKGGIDHVCCSTASSDTHPPSNLIQSDGNSGEFLADHFIKPPVFLYFHVPARLAASLVQIKADTNVGEQISSTVEISGCDEDITCCQRCQRKDKNESLNIEQHDYRTHNLFTFLGKTQAEDNHVAFTNTKLLRREINTCIIKDREESQTKVINNIRIICVGIKRTLNASIPCLKNLKILVKPKDSESRKILDELKQASYRTTTLNFFGGGGEISEPVKSVIQPQQNTIFQQQIPEEFLDEITQEIMQIPMILPSGKIVDRSTVDKCNTSQAVYGGLPRDPFSGRVYTSSLKPVFNASLKSRIDEFVTENKIEIHTGQTVGNARSIQEFLENKHLQNPRKRKFLEDM